MSNVIENLKFGNYVSTTLNGAILAGDGAMTVTSTVNMPAVTTANGQYFYLELQQVASPANREIVKVTNVTGSILTITRAQDGTSALGFADGDRVRANINVALLDDLRDELKAPIDFVDYAIPGAAVPDQTDAAVTGSIAEIMANYGAAVYHTIILRPGTYTIPNSLICDQYTSFIILGGATFDFTVDSKTLTLQGGVEAGHYPIKTAGSGTDRKMLIPNQPAYIEWWGKRGISLPTGQVLLRDAAIGATHLIISEGSINIEDNLTLDSSLKFIEFQNNGQLAKSSGKTLTFSDQELIAPDAMYILKNDSGTFAGTINNDSVSVHWFGATGDGTTDDEIAIEAAITFSRAGGTITFISGLTYQTDTINISKQIRLFGGHLRAKDDIGGNGVIELAATADDSVVENMTIEVPVTVTGGGGNVAGIKVHTATDRVRIGNCVFSCSSLLGAVYGRNSTGLIVENCVFKDTPPARYAIFIVGMVGCVITNCIIIDGADYGIKVDGGEDNHISGCVIRNATGDGINAGGTTSNLSIIGNTITGCYTRGISLSSGVDDVVISGNNIRDSGAEGIMVSDDADGVVISGNSITDEITGIEIIALANDVVIYGNVLSGNTTAISDLGGTNVKISGNVGGPDELFLARCFTATGGAAGHALLADTWTDVVLNDEVLAADFASIDVATGIITLAAGTYDYVFSNSIHDSSMHETQSRLYNNDADPAATIPKSASIGFDMDGGENTVQLMSRGRFTLSSSSAIVLQTWTFYVGYLGKVTSSGEDNVFAQIEIRRL
jgi:hypothetical protein